MTKILVPTDFSETAEKALRYAMQIAARSEGEIYLCHIYTPTNNPFIETVDQREIYNVEQERNLMGDLHRLREKVQPGAPDVKIVAVLGRSPLVGSILKFADDNQVDMIVMGTQGASGLQKVLVGTVAVRIMEKTSLPLLLIPEEYEWKQPEQIVLATGYHQDDTQALYISGFLASMFDAGIKVVHLIDSDKQDAGKAQASLEEYSASLQEAAGNMKLEHHLLESGSIGAGLEKLCAEVPYDLLVMVKRQKTFFERFYMESMTNRIAYLTEKPLLVVPALVSGKLK